jgi:two-component system, cell cycle response regulator
MTLPMPLAPAPAPAGGVDLDLPLQGAGGGGREVLVVDDSAIARTFLAQRLTAFGYQVHLANDGEQALTMCAEQAFAIVFVDVQLGGEHSVDGLRVCQRLKRHPRVPGSASPAVVVVTGDATASTRVRGALAGCDAYLVKPLLEAEFVAALRTVDARFEWESVRS